MAEMQQLLLQMVEQNKALAEQNKLQQDHIVGLIDSIKAMPGIQRPIAVQVQPPQVNAAAARIEKICRLSVGMRKSTRLKVFKACDDCDIKLFIKQFDGELETVKQMVGITDALDDREYVPIFRAALDFAVLERVGQVFKKDPLAVKTWEAIIKDDLHILMVDEFGAKNTDVADVLRQFGPSRISKSPDMSIHDFFYKWNQNIPDVMKPTTGPERERFVDLIHRSMFYISLDDTHYHQALSDLKDPNPTLQIYFNEAIAAESRRRMLQDIATSSSILDSKGGVVISKWESSDQKSDSENLDISQGAISKYKGSKQTNQKPKKSDLYCTHCKKKYHDVNNCWALGRGTFKKTNKKKINSMEADDEGSGSYKEVDNQDDPFNFNALCAVNPTSPVFKSFATTVEPHPLATTESLMTRLHIEGIGILKMEVDTAASHNIITEKCFYKLQGQLIKRGMENQKERQGG